MSSHPISSKVTLKLVPLLYLGIARVSFLAVLEPNSLPYTWHTPPQSHLTGHDLITPNNIRRGVNITKFIIMEFSPLSSYFLQLSPNTLFTALFSITLGQCVSLNVTDQVTTSHSLCIFPSSVFTYFFMIRKTKY
jgi:hypothetical protein